MLLDSKEVYEKQNKNHGVVFYKNWQLRHWLQANDYPIRGLFRSIWNNRVINLVRNSYTVLYNSLKPCIHKVYQFQNTNASIVEATLIQFFSMFAVFAYKTRPFENTRAVVAVNGVWDSCS